MGEKIYKPIIKDGDHLVKSSKNPNRVRGQSRDANNKNPDIIEWEEVDIDDYVSKETDQDMYYNKSQDESDSGVDTLDTINLCLELVNNALGFLNDHPEVVVAIAKGGKKVKKIISKGTHKIAIGVKSAFKKKNSIETKEIPRVNDLKDDEGSVEIVIQTNESDVIETTISEEDERVEMSVEEARSLVIDTLINYINMRKNIDMLSNAQINNIDMPQIDIEKIISLMEGIVLRYPSLIDKDTSVSIFDILNSYPGFVDSDRIIETLNIEKQY